PTCQVFALEPETGTQKWHFDPEVDLTANYSELTNRGVATWIDEATGERRLYLGTLDARLICIDAKSGRPIETFGAKGVVDLKEGIRLRGSGQYQVTSPPAI